MTDLQLHEDRRIRGMVSAVRREPASGVIFPDIRENTGNFQKYAGFGQFAVKKTLQVQSLSSGFP